MLFYAYQAVRTRMSANIRGKEQRDGEGYIQARKAYERSRFLSQGARRRRAFPADHEEPGQPEIPLCSGPAVPVGEGLAEICMDREERNAGRLQRHRIV